MKLPRIGPVTLLAAVVFATGCDGLLDPEEDLLGVVCEAGNDPVLPGDWWATAYDWGEGDMVAQGWDLNVQLYEDGDGKLVETHREEQGGVIVPVSDSAFIRWGGCDGRLAIVIQEEFIGSGTGGFEDVLFDYTASGGGLLLSGGGMSITMTGNGQPPRADLDEALWGSWTATSIVYTNREFESQPVDMVADHGHSMQVFFAESGAFEEIYDDPDHGSETYTGTWHTMDGVLTLHFSDGTGMDLHYEVTGTGARVWADQGDYRYDFDGDGTEELAAVEWTFERS